MSLVIDSYKFAGVGTPTLATATHYWISKNNATFFDSGTDALKGQITAAGLQRGSTSGADSADPTWSNDGTYELLQCRTDDHLTTTATAAKDFTGDFTLLIVLAPQGTSATLPLSSRPSSSNGIEILQSASNISGRAQNPTSGSVNTGTVAQPSVGTLSYYALRRTGSTFSVHVNGTTSSTVTFSGSVSSASDLYVAARGGGGTNNNQDFYGLAVWNGSYQSDANLVSAKNEVLSLAAL